MGSLLRHGPRKPAGSYKKALKESLAELTFQKNHFVKNDLLMQTLWRLPTYGLAPEQVFDKVDAFEKLPADRVAWRL